MGITKRMMMEAEECDYGETIIDFTCPKCKKSSDGYAEIPIVDRYLTGDLEVSLDIQCIWCNHSYKALFSLYSDQLSLTFDDYPDTKINFEPLYSTPLYEDFPEGEYFYDTPENPIEFFMNAYQDVDEFLNKYSVQNGQNAMNRMIFMQSFSAFEAFLCDSFFNLVFSDEETKKLFINKYKGFRNIKFSLEDMQRHKELTAGEIINRKITQKIREVLFHNLARTASLFGIYKISIFSSSEDKEFLFKSADYRHHCVHRNGKDMEGNELDIFTKEYIRKTIKIMMETAVLIDGNISKRKFEELGF